MCDDDGKENMAYMPYSVYITLMNISEEFKVKEATTFCCRTTMINADGWIDKRIEEMEKGTFNEKEHAHELACGCPQYDRLVKAYRKMKKNV